MSIRDRILEEATSMFVTNGLKSVRMDDIAAQMGISKRTIYETFGDKENLVAACMRYFFTQKRALACQRSAEAANIIEELMVNLGENEEMMKRTLGIVSDLRKFYPQIYSNIEDESFESGTREIKEVLRKGVEQGIFISQMDTDLTVAIFIDLMHAVLNRINSLALKDMPIHQTIRFCVIFFIRGISTKQGVELIDEYLENKYKKTETL